MLMRARAFLRPRVSGPRLKESKIPIRRTAFKEAKTINISGSLQSFAASDPDFKFLAQKCFTAYVRSVYLQKDKDIFNVHALPLTEYASALGLPGEPRVRFLDKSGKKGDDADALRKEAHKQKNKSRKLQMLKEKIKKEKLKKKLMKSQGASDSAKVASDSSSSDDEGEESVTVWRRLSSLLQVSFRPWLLVRKWTTGNEDFNHVCGTPNCGLVCCYCGANARPPVFAREWARHAGHVGVVECDRRLRQVWGFKRPTDVEE